MFLNRKSVDTATGHLNRGQLAAYAGLSLPLALVVFPAYAILPGFYAQHTAISLATIGVILTVSRAFDALVDPLIGYCSDRTKSRWGSRKPWVLIGTVVLAISMPRLYVPAPDATAWSYLFWFLMFYLGYSLIEIPHKAWGTELARDYQQRSLIATALAVAFSIGTLLFAAAPFVRDQGNKGYDAEALSLVANVFVVALPVLALFALRFVPTATTRDVVSPLAPREILRGLMLNRPLRWFLCIFILTGLGQGIFYGLVFLYLTKVLPFKQHFALVLLVDAVVSLAGLPVWYRVIVTVGKHRAWSIGMVISAAALSCMLLIPEGPTGLTVLLILIALRALGSSVVYVAPNALIGDVVDFELYKSGANLAANFHAVVSLATKGTATLGGGLGLILVGLIGFDPKLPSSASTAFTFACVATVLPAFLLLGASIAAWTFPLTRRHQRTIERALLKRRSRING